MTEIVPAVLAQMPPVADFLIWVERVGFPVACVVALALAVWRVSAWLASEVVRPLTAKHMDYLDKSGSATETNARSLQKIADSHEKLVDLAEEAKVAQANGVEKIVTKLDEHHGEVISRLEELVPPGGGRRRATPPG